MSKRNHLIHPAQIVNVTINADPNLERRFIKGKYKLVGRKVVPFEGSLDEWAQWNFQEENRRVAADNINGYYISTVFLGDDHGWAYGASEPVVFETMVFGPTGQSVDNPHGVESERCSTYDEAEAMHAEACAWVKKQYAQTSMEDSREYLKTVSKDT